MTNPIRNQCVKECLLELGAFKRNQAVQLMNRTDLPPFRLLQHSLIQRKRIEERLREEGNTSDYDPLVLSAFQEAMREAVVRKGPGLQVSPGEVAARLQQLDLPELWEMFVKHYLGNYLEWKATAAQVEEDLGEHDTAEIVETMRKEFAPELAKKVTRQLKNQYPSTKWRDVSTYVDAFAEVMARELE